MKGSPFVFKILIVEDDFSFALDLQMLVEELGYEVHGLVDSGEKGLELIQRSQPDAILMDIDLRGEMTGIELADKIKELSIPILFITSHKDPSQYQRAKSLGMVGFLVKPLNEFTLLSAMDACLSRLKHTPVEQSEVPDMKTRLLKDSLLVKKGKVYHKVKLSDIIFINSDLEYATIHTSQEQFTFRESLKNLTELLDDRTFYRTHQSHIINIEYLKSIDTEDSVAIMANAQQVPVSRRRRKELEERWYSYG